MEKELKNYTNEEILAEVARRFQSNDSLPKPKKEVCFKCEKDFSIKFVAPRGKYSQKNYWSYWTGKKTDEKKKICNSCLKSFYLNERKEFLTTVKDLKKRNHLRSYVSHNVI